MNWDSLDLSILGPALLAGLLVLLTHVPLGQQVLKRGIIFLDLAVAQIAGLGVMIATSFHWTSDSWQAQLMALSAALTGALLLYAVEKYWTDIQEAVIGCIFVLAACAGILLLHSHPQGGEELKALLSGQILWVSYTQLIPVAIIYALIISIWLLFKQSLHASVFYLSFAVSITLSVQLVGVYLVFASLIMPALAVKYYTRFQNQIALFIGIASYLLGLCGSALFDWPSGATIVWVLAILSLCALCHGRYRDRTAQTIVK